MHNLLRRSLRKAANTKIVSSTYATIPSLEKEGLTAENLRPKPAPLTVKSFDDLLRKHHVHKSRRVRVSLTSADKGYHGENLPRIPAHAVTMLPYKSHEFHNQTPQMSTAYSLFAKKQIDEKGMGADIAAFVHPRIIYDHLIDGAYDIDVTRGEEPPMLPGEEGEENPFANPENYDFLTPEERARLQEEFELAKSKGERIHAMGFASIDHVSFKNAINMMSTINSLDEAEREQLFDDIDDVREEVAEEWAEEPFHDEPYRGEFGEHDAILTHSNAVNEPVRNDAGRFYTIPSDEYNAIFGVTGMAGQYDKICEQLHQRAIMVRRQALGIIGYLTAIQRSVEQSNFQIPAELPKVPGFLLHGDRGTGKSVIMNHLVHWASKSGWMTVFVPSAYEWTHGVHYVEPSALLKGYYDAPIPSKKFLQAFFTANRHIIEDRPLAGPAQLYESLPLEVGQNTPTTLGGLVQYGLTFDSNVAVVLKLVMDELLQINDIPMLIAVDDYNYFHDYTYYTYGNILRLRTRQAAENPKQMLHRVHASEYVLVRGLHRLLQQQTKAIQNQNKVFIGALTEKRPEKTPSGSVDKLVNEKLSVLEPVLVEAYSPRELRNMLQYYSSVHWIMGGEIVEQSLEEFNFMTGGIGERVFKQAALF